MVKYYHEKEKATQITVCLSGDVQRYAMSFLHIWNNAREFPHTFYKVENLSGSNNVIVTCNPKREEDVIGYLEQFGEIKYSEEINWFVIHAEYDRRGWNELWGDDCEVDFAIDIE